MPRQSSRRRLLRGLASAALGASLAGCAGGDGGGTTVEMTDALRFDPADVSVAVGETVTWTTVGETGHTVTAYADDLPDGAAYFASGGFDSEAAARTAYAAGESGTGDVPSGESYAHTFETPGAYRYFCIPHERAGMTGTVEVGAG